MPTCQSQNSPHRRYRPVRLSTANGAGPLFGADRDRFGHLFGDFLCAGRRLLAYIDSEQVTIVVRDTNRSPLIVTTGARTINEGQIL